MSEREVLARRLRVERAARGWGLKEAAEKIGIQRDTLSALEKGRRGVYSGTLERIAHAYNLSLAELLGEETTLAGKARAPATGPQRENCYTIDELKTYFSTHPEVYAEYFLYPILERVDGGPVPNMALMHMTQRLDEMLFVFLEALEKTGAKIVTDRRARAAENEAGLQSAARAREGAQR